MATMGPLPVTRVRATEERSVAAGAPAARVRVGVWNIALGVLLGNLLTGAIVALVWWALTH